MASEEEAPHLHNETSPVTDTHNIAILGGNFGGVSVAHYLLRHVLPGINSMSDGFCVYKITLISPSTHFFFKIGAPRALTSAEAVPLEKSFLPISEAFKDYNQSYYTFVQGEAIGIDEVTKRVIVKHENDTPDSDVKYDSLVIATGTTSKSPLWTLHGNYTITKSAFEDLHARLPKAEKIFIVGGGASAVETAGEIAYRYKGKDITILSGSTRLLAGLKNVGVGVAAESQLTALGVKTVNDVRVTSVVESADSKTVLKLSNGATEEVDVYIDATGGQPNSSFLPAAWLDERNRVATDGTTLRADKAPAGVYCIGDVASYSTGSVLDVEYAVRAICYSIWFDLFKDASAKQEKAANGTKVIAPHILKEQKYKKIQSDMQFVPIGPQGGVGAFFGWKVPSWIVWLIKSRTMFFERAPGLVEGEAFIKA
ncbi:FAD/NAD(P)-binding domain-containing protein [Lepidopterella palustris CBS 459.81]|uniref:FAD/NAD(P)-binding domain-containing protein n=1 Tax=Lepidopterella palustris CBS 459.81 TaxID=1314670 RepID=A0A8E2E5M8_9PEZI|nr:FAD/NAD(P)-binding domain-containing protein [Lepidopterella palustris CBS 459.81]